MSLFGALSASLTSLTAQSSAVNSISNNIANIRTTGFKATEVSFSTLVTGNIGGGVLQGFRNEVGQQGAIQASNVGTDLAIQGSGFFTVNDVSGNLFYTRAGSFRTDSTGNLVNEAGLQLQGWPLDPKGNLPGEGDNPNATSNQDVASLVPISTASITGTASPTTSISAKVNLKAEEAVLKGSGDVVTFNPTGANTTNSANDVIAPSTADMVAGETFTITPGEGTVSTFTYGGFTQSHDITATSIGGASTTSGAMTGFTDGDDFTITIGSNDPYTFTYQSNPDLDSGQFSNMNELAQIINASDGLTSRIENNRIYVAGTEIGVDIDFDDPNSSGLVTAFNFSDIVGDSNTFATLQNLADLVNNSSDFVANIISPTGNSTLDIYNVDPTDTIVFSDSIAGDDLLDDFGITSSIVASAYEPESVTTPLRSLASGNVSPDFSRTLTVYTSLGEGLDIRVAFVKLVDGTVSTGGQTWGVELFAANPDDINVANRDDGLIASGEISFDGDGALTTFPTAFNEITIQPSGGASALNISLDLGTIGTTDGLSQFAGQYSVDELSQNGFPTGRLQSLQISAEGFVTAIFDNSLTSRVYKLPVAYFSNPNGLTPESGNAYSANNNAGEVTLGQVGDASVGTIVPSALEVSTAEIGEELTKTILSQQAYSASANVLRKVTELFDELRNL